MNVYSCARQLSSTLEPCSLYVLKLWYEPFAYENAHICGKNNDHDHACSCTTLASVSSVFVEITFKNTEAKTSM